MNKELKGCLCTEFLQMLPYIGVVRALIVIGRNMRLPSGLGRAYDREGSRGGG